MVMPLYDASQLPHPEFKEKLQEVLNLNSQHSQNAQDHVMHPIGDKLYDYAGITHVFIQWKKCYLGLANGKLLLETPVRLALSTVSDA